MLPAASTYVLILDLAASRSAGATFDDDRGLVLVHCGVSPAVFGLRREQCLAWGLDAERQLCVTIEFGRDYTASTAVPKKFPTFQSRDKDLFRSVPPFPSVVVCASIMSVVVW